MGNVCIHFLVLSLFILVSGCSKAKFKNAATVGTSPVPEIAAKIWTLPKPDLKLIPAVPLGWDTHPGGSGFPVWKDGNDAGAPAIGFQTDTTFANETIALMGENLKGADFVLWAEGVTIPVTALRTDADRAQVIVPADAATPIPKSVMFLWPHNANGYGTPIRLNAPVLFWVWPGKKFTNDSDRNVRIFGKNLYLSEDKEPLVVMQRAGDSPVSLQITHKTANEIRASLPSGYSAGEYRVWVHNGSGGSYGWSEAGNFEVSVNTYSTSREFPVGRPSGNGNPDQDKIYNAILAASNAGGGTVTFSSGIYTLTGDPNIPDANVSANGGGPIILKGAGSGAGGTVIYAAGTVSSPERSINLNGAGSGIRDIKLNGVGINVQNQDVNVDNVHATKNNHPINIYEKYMSGGVHPRQKINLNVTNSTIVAVNAGAYVGWASFIRFSNCHFFGRYNNGVYNEFGTKISDNNLDNQGISFRSTHNVIVENCDFQSEAPLAGKILTRAIAVLHSNDSHHVYLNNIMNAIGAFPSSPYRDINSGEIILFHGNDFGVMSTVVSADWDSVTVNRPDTDFTENDFHTYTYTETKKRAIEFDLLKVYVISGPATGQILSLKSVKSNGAGKALLQVSRWQHVMPRAGDKVLVRAMFYQNLILNNKIDAVPEPQRVNVDFSRVGVMFYCPSHDSVISGNTIKHARTGIYIQSGPGVWIQGANHIRGNTVTDNIQGGYGGEQYSTMCYEENVGLSYRPEDRIYSLGNVFRDNTCSGSQVGVAIGGRGNELYKALANVGVLHSIIENNTITRITGTPGRPNLGVSINVFANWALLRNNKMDYKGNIDFNRRDLTYDVLHIE